jgi:light-regulated signal transduction histidine kinase (bacteriophytochrome)
VSAALDTSNCETEPLRFPGAVQPHGALLVVDLTSTLIEAASESCTEWLGRPAAALLGLPLATVLGAAADTLLQPGGRSLRDLVRLSVNGRELRARASVNQAGQQLIDIEEAGEDFGRIERAVYHRRRVLGRLRALTDMGQIAAQATELVRGLTDFDRVMLYRFDADWNVEIIGESRVPEAESYLGMHFPASDIPKQARELFQFGHVRYIRDVRYAASALVARGDERAVDLGESSLRSVSPMHIEYLENMGVRATLVGSLVVEGRLWGLMSCHQLEEPKPMEPAFRDAMEWLCEDLSVLIEATLVKQRAARAAELGVLRRRLVERLRHGDFRELLAASDSSDLLDVVGADGFALIDQGSLKMTGRTPSAERIRRLQERRRAVEQAPTFYASDALRQDLGVDDTGDGVAGAVFVSLRNIPAVTLIWFRNERRECIRWGGDPDKMRLMDERGRLSPRKSFRQFQQVTDGRCLAWTQEEQLSAVELCSLIEIEALKRSEAVARSILHSNPNPTALLDDTGVIVSVNHAWARWLRQAPPSHTAGCAPGMRYGGLCGDALVRDGVHSVLRGGRPEFNRDHAVDGPEGAHWVRVRAYAVQAPGEGVVVKHEDVSERRLTQVRLEKLVEARTAELAAAYARADAEHRANAHRQRLDNEIRMRSSKLEAVGTLAAGIAHDFNNILASIVGFAEMAGDELPADSAVKGNIEQILHGSFRARDLVARMLAFARESKTDPKPVELVAQVREAMAFLRASVRASIEILVEDRMDHRPALVLADPVQVLQVVMNLCINSVDAIENHGLITVTVEPAGEHAYVPEGLEAGVCLSVADDGEGLTSEVRERLFDPFFTTKAPGAGSGLGLSVVYGIVSSIGGVIKVRSGEPGMPRGTVFHLFLPAAPWKPGPEL